VQEIEEAWHADMQSMFMNGTAGAGDMAVMRGNCLLYGKITLMVDLFDAFVAFPLFH